MDKNGKSLKFGDRVHYFIPGHGTNGGYAYVAGEMKYSENGSHVLLVNDTEIGMPINAGHCTLQSSGHDELVAPLRDRYMERFPDALLRNEQLTKKEG